MDFRFVRRPEMIGGQHDPQRAFERPAGIGQEFRDAPQRLFLLGVEDVQSAHGAPSAT
ncbi:MAG: hypothetical protein MI785_22750 [Kiloniellales bacterium]|nr:hypothetical protein [Kiloniellales bacterium]